MINKIPNIFSFEINPAKAAVKSNLRMLPPVNTFVEIEVLDVRNNLAKILVDDSLFKTMLPINLPAGETIIAKVAGRSPFTLELNGFNEILKNNDIAMTSLLSKLYVSESASAKNVIGKLVDAKRPLVKSKIRRLLEYINDSDREFDEVELFVLIGIVWENSSDVYERCLDTFDMVFDIDFAELSKRIFESVDRIHRMNLGSEFYLRLNNSIVFDFSAGGLNDLMHLLGDKSKIFSELINYIEFYINNEGMQGYKKEELSALNFLLLKYIMQKAVYGYFGIHPEFVIVGHDDECELINYSFEAAGESENFSLKIQKSLSKKNPGTVKLNGILTKNFLIGKIAPGPVKIDNNLKYLVEELENNLRLKTDIEIVSERGGDERNGKMVINIENLNVHA